MTIDINNINPQRPENSRSQTARNEAAPKREAPADTQQQGSENAPNVSVSLSEAGKTLAQVEASLKSSPEIDQAKVDEMRAKIESGDYQIDSQNLAQKMLDIDS